MRFFAVALIFFGVAASYAQAPEVPHKIHFAGMVLTIRDDAKREIQKDVDALTRHKRYFEMIAERARTYFPIIEKIFREEQLPEDFKYLALQESALTPDAVSVSDAVGFWQFKDFTAQEMGMRVDHQIDERMNIVSSTHGAARYIKQNNWRFNNWVLALQAYQMGAGGVERAVGDQYNGDRHMEITSETYWYVKKFLAHKVAFEGACQGAPKVMVSLYKTESAMKWRDIANEVSVDENTLREYNKWSKKGTIPDDKPYQLIIPGATSQDFSSLTLTSAKASKASPRTKGTHDAARIEINGVEAIRAMAGETLSTISSRAGLDVAEFIKFNDQSIDQEIRQGIPYFLKRKKKKNPAASYRTRMGDDLWLVSQQFGIRLKNLRKLNPEVKEGLLASGTSVVLNPNSAPISSPVIPTEGIAELSNDTFVWGAQPGATNAVTEKTAPRSNSGTDTLARSKQDLATPPAVTMDTIPSRTLTNQPEMFTYEVKSSDTLYGIARQFGATIKEIMDWNNKSALTVTMGEKLKILKR